MQVSVHVRLHAHVELVEGCVVAETVGHLSAFCEALSDPEAADTVGTLKILLFVEVCDPCHEAVRTTNQGVFVFVSGRTWSLDQLLRCVAVQYVQLLPSL